MDAVAIYINYKNKTISQLETEMKYIAERNAELERLIREAEEAKTELKKNRERMMELAIEYASLKGEL